MYIHIYPIKNGDVAAIANVSVSGGPTTYYKSGF